MKVEFAITLLQTLERDTPNGALAFLRLSGLDPATIEWLYRVGNYALSGDNEVSYDLSDYSITPETAWECVCAKGDEAVRRCVIAALRLLIKEATIRLPVEDCV